MLLEHMANCGSLPCLIDQDFGQVASIFGGEGDPVDEMRKIKQHPTALGGDFQVERLRIVWHRADISLDSAPILRLSRSHRQLPISILRRMLRKARGTGA